MNWLNIKVHTLRSPEIIAAPPAALGTWIRVLGYCCECENGGVIAGASGWNDRQWMTACGVTASEVAEASPLLRNDGAAVVVALYPDEKQQEVQERRAKASENGKKGGRPRKDDSEKPTLVNSGKPTLVSVEKPVSVNIGKAEREREGELERELERKGELERETECEREQEGGMRTKVSGKPDAAAVEILHYLNEKADRQFRDTDENLKLISARLKSVDGDAAGIKLMIERQVKLWADNPKMAEFLRPVTLFGNKNFGGYYDLRTVPVVKDGNAPRRPGGHADHLHPAFGQEVPDLF